MRDMISEKEKQARDRFLYCPACATALHLVHQFLDPEHGKTIRLFECERCGERIWDD